jgi:hypothetical protein
MNSGKFSPPGNFGFLEHGDGEGEEGDGEGEEGDGEGEEGERGGGEGEWGGEEGTNYAELCQLLFSLYYFITHNRFTIAKSRHPQPSVLIKQLLPR